MFESKDYIIVVLLGFSIITTGIGGLVIWKAIKKNIELSKDIFDLSASIVKIQHQFQMELNWGYREKLHREAKVVYEALEAQSLLLMQNAPRFHSLRTEQLVKSFSEEERRQIDEAWEVFNNYLKDHWITSSGEFINGLNRDSKEIAVSEARFPIMLFKELINMGR